VIYIQVARKVFNDYFEESVLLWKDIWMGEQPLWQQTPNLERYIRLRFYKIFYVKNFYDI
jgi:hypothetical protein